ncbi:MAG: hypothetical protein FWF81_08895 [Defluviitaleaceae bacterium]|nr:hypothetical protein [Defluviitaleaceae bacterium]
MKPYDEVYTFVIMRTQGRVFLDIREALQGVDEKWFIESYMKSKIRSLLDHANPKFAAMPSPELIDYFIKEENGGKYKTGEEWGGFLPQWTGMIYSFYQWTYNISSYKLVEMLPLAEMERIFPTLHQAGWDVAIKKIHDEVLKG